LEAIREGKSVTNHYIDKKNGMESIDYFHPSLESSLKTTYGEMIYQEQAMQIARDIAGFNLQEADMLRKAIGKKKPEEMAKVKKTFIEGSKNQNIVSSDQAEEIFGWIEKSQRYSFNKSHSISYAINAYLSAYTKAHFPKVFFASYLRFAKDKIDPKAEIKELVQNAREMDIEV
jgi:DNA polymerase-3 subunit alpha